MALPAIFDPARATTIREHYANARGEDCISRALSFVAINIPSTMICFDPRDLGIRATLQSPYGFTSENTHAKCLQTPAGMALVLVPSSLCFGAIPGRAAYGHLRLRTSQIGLSTLVVGRVFLTFCVLLSSCDGGFSYLAGFRTLVCSLPRRSETAMAIFAAPDFRGISASSCRRRSDVGIISVHIRWSRNRTIENDPLRSMAEWPVRGILAAPSTVLQSVEG